MLKFIPALNYYSNGHQTELNSKELFICRAVVLERKTDRERAIQEKEDDKEKCAQASAHLPRGRVNDASEHSVRCMDVTDEVSERSVHVTASPVSNSCPRDAVNAFDDISNHNLTSHAAQPERSDDSLRESSKYVSEAGESDSTLTSTQTNRSSRGVIDDIAEEDDENDAPSHQPSSSDFFMVTKIDEFGFIRGPDSDGRSAAVDLVTLRKREKKWLHMLSNWSHFMNNKYEKVRERCRKGIPASLRGRAWKHLCGAAFHMEYSVNKHVFEEVSAQPGDPRWVDDIKKDLNRQFPEHVMFSRCGPYGKGGKKDLFELLKAYTVLHPEEGYCQGQAPVASVLLMHMPLRDAFYCFVQICHKYLPGYYSAGLEAIQIDGDILFQLLKEKSKLSYRHLVSFFLVDW
ncbi:unnamed protein product [Toxocara canis]|uniref:Rab-GAP TBC domain-containing protein n=1 Tax=Toxocara canis TaxID=6265 RepID=A0A183UNC2_TOXCA|nr:unnamed protein product [Toxocara canis]